MLNVRGAVGLWVVVWVVPGFGSQEHLSKLDNYRCLEAGTSRSGTYTDAQCIAACDAEPACVAAELFTGGTCGGTVTCYKHTRCTGTLQSDCSRLYFKAVATSAFWKMGCSDGATNCCEIVDDPSGDEGNCFQTKNYPSTYAPSTACWASYQYSEHLTLETNLEMADEVVAYEHGRVISGTGSVILITDPLNVDKTNTLRFKSNSAVEWMGFRVCVTQGTPTFSPSAGPSTSPSNAPTRNPSFPPSASPSFSPTASPSGSPSAAPSVPPSLAPSRPPTASPSTTPSVPPTLSPSASPSKS
eukprot:Hpha_TRINITY_DN28503_c0_g1::TRINITY_DN28503_c0_g1_i1::g.18657::m.18657